MKGLFAQLGPQSPLLPERDCSLWSVLLLLQEIRSPGAQYRGRLPRARAIVMCWCYQGHTQGSFGDLERVTQIYSRTSLSCERCVLVGYAKLARVHFPVVLEGPRSCPTYRLQSQIRDGDGSSPTSTG